MITPDIKLEVKLWKEGFSNVVGIDEAGRGPLAGPVSAGAVLINSADQVVQGVRDSKKMSEKQREEVFEKIKEVSTAWGVGLASSEEIDRFGIQKSVRIAMERALNEVKKKVPKIDYLIVDGKNVSKIPGFKMEKITKGDMYHYSISAASVLAKVTRDRIMKEMSIKYPHYGFEKHVGYGTKLHMEMLCKYGPCRMHRRSFKPVGELING
ncbi:ribonuclease HII [Candidatus Dojkabacteria bacterium]|nr:ribonuclease HII [Candidatus Dojkabacteria bacterium]